MKRILQFLGGAMLVSLVLTVGLLIAAMAMSGGMDATTIRIDGDTVDLSGLGAAQSVLAIIGVAAALLVALLIALLVVPLAMLIPLGITAVALIGLALVLAGIVAMLCSPLIIAVLAVWLIVRLARRSRQPKAAAAGATIAA